MFSKSFAKAHVEGIVNESPAIRHYYIHLDSERTLVPILPLISAETITRN